jgi:hypothetical protein
MMVFSHLNFLGLHAPSKTMMKKLSPQYPRMDVGIVWRLATRWQLNTNQQHAKHYNPLSVTIF